MKRVLIPDNNKPNPGVGTRIQRDNACRARQGARTGRQAANEAAVQAV